MTREKAKIQDKERYIVSMLPPYQILNPIVAPEWQRLIFAKQLETLSDYNIRKATLHLVLRLQRADFYQDVDGQDHP